LRLGNETVKQSRLLKSNLARRCHPQRNENGGGKREEFAGTPKQNKTGSYNSDPNYSVGEKRKVRDELDVLQQRQLQTVRMMAERKINPFEYSRCKN